MTKKGIMMKTLLLVGVLSLASIQAHALADGPSCAVVKRTPDGFLNLRAVFNGTIIAKLRPGDLLYVNGIRSRHFDLSRLLKKGRLPLTLNCESDSYANEGMAGGIDARFGYADG